MNTKSENAPAIFKRIVKQLSKQDLHQELKLDFEVHKKLLSFFQVGDYYYYVFNLSSGDFEFISPEIENMLGCKPDIPITTFLGKIHPEDLPWFLNFENKVVEFFSQLRPDQILKYKVQYDYRIRKTNGEYIRILQQVVTIQYNEETGIVRTFGIHTDISHLKKEGRPVMSLIGLEGEPSYINVDVKNIFKPEPSVISEREKQVLRLLIEGKASKEIADHLSISWETVNKHRKNILSKTKTASTPELVAKAVKEAWV